MVFCFLQMCRKGIEQLMLSFNYFEYASKWIFAEDDVYM